MLVRFLRKKNDWKSLLKQLHTWLTYWKKYQSLPTCLFKSGTAKYWSRSEKAMLSLCLKHVNVGLLNSTPTPACLDMLARVSTYWPRHWRSVLWNVVQQCVNRHVGRDTNNAINATSAPVLCDVKMWQVLRLHRTHDWSCTARRQQRDSAHWPRGLSHILKTRICTLTWLDMSARVSADWPRAYTCTLSWKKFDANCTPTLGWPLKMYLGLDSLGAGTSQTVPWPLKL